jgi:hypothetical protein
VPRRLASGLAATQRLSHSHEKGQAEGLARGRALLAVPARDYPANDSIAGQRARILGLFPANR